MYDRCTAELWRLSFWTKRSVQQHISLSLATFIYIHSATLPVAENVLSFVSFRGIALSGFANSWGRSKIKNKIKIPELFGTF